MKKFIAMTAVAYESGDILGYFLAWASLIPIFALVAECTAFIVAETSKRRKQAGCLLVGQLLNEGLNMVLKRLFQIPRPSTSERNDYGMPSSHSQFVAYAFFAMLTILPTRERSAKAPHIFGIKEATLISLFKYCSFLAMCSVLCSRIYLGYHDLMQVLGGAMMGAVTSIIWRFFYIYHTSGEGRDKLRKSYWIK